MKKIDFTKLNVETAIDQFDEMDLTKEMGNFLFTVAPNLEIDELARKIYSLTDIIEIEDSLFEQMLQLMEGKVSFRVIQAIKKHSNE